MTKTGTLNVVITAEDPASKALQNLGNAFRIYSWAWAAGYLGVTANRKTRLYLKRRRRLIRWLILEAAVLLVLIGLVWWLK